MTDTDIERGTADPSVRTENLRIRSFEPLPTPSELRAELPLTDQQRDAVERGRSQVQAVLDGIDDRLLVIVGPCSIHDPEVGLEYAARLASLADRVSDDLLIVMRTYFEKPRTTVGWKGLVNDPHLDGSHDIATGLRLARRFLLDVTELGLPAATEFLEPISPQHLADLISWGAIGARTAESQIHRQLVSGLSMPVGFKNGTDGSVQVAIDACRAAAAGQTFLGIDDDGRASLVSTAGNADTHLVLRGGADGPNHGPQDVLAAAGRLSVAGVRPRLVVDASHGNSGKDHVRQASVAGGIADQIEGGQAAIAGVMLESFLEAGAQPLEVEVGPRDLVRGQSVTDACMGWDASVTVLERLASASRVRRTAARATVHG